MLTPKQRRITIAAPVLGCSAKNWSLPSGIARQALAAIVLSFLVTAAASRVADANGAWSLVPLPAFRSTAAGLADDKLFLAGGVAPQSQSTFTLLDARLLALSNIGPVRGQFVQSTPIVLVDGRVLIIGDSQLPRKPVAAWVFDPVTKQFKEIASPIYPITDQYAGILLGDGRVLIAGGATPAGATAKSEIYNAVTNEWTTAPDLPEPRSEAAIVLLRDGRVLIVGGQANQADPSSTQPPMTYLPGAPSWQSTGPIPFLGRGSGLSRLNDGTVIVAGGSDAKGRPTNQAELYQPSTNEWRPLLPMVEGRASPGVMQTADGRVVVAGGSGGSAGVVSVEALDVPADRWTRRQEMAAGGAVTSTVELTDGRFALLTVRGLQIYDPVADAGPSTQTLPEAIRGAIRGVQLFAGDLTVWLLVGTGLGVASLLTLLLSVAVPRRLRRIEWPSVNALQIAGTVVGAAILLSLAGRSHVAFANPAAGQSPAYAFLLRPASQEIVAAAQISLELMLVTAVWSSCIGLALAVLATSVQRRRLPALDGVSTVLWAVPTFLLAILAQEIQAFVFGHTGLVLAAGFGDINAAQVAWSSLVLGLRPATYFYRHGRRILLLDAESDFGRTALAKGLGWGAVVRHHLLRAGASSLVAVWLNSVRLMIGSLPLVEYFFGLPGLGRVLVLSLGVPQGGRVTLRPDIAIGLIVILGVTLILAEQMASLLQRLLDPRLKGRLVAQ